MKNQVFLVFMLLILLIKCLICDDSIKRRQEKISITDEGGGSTVKKDSSKLKEVDLKPRPMWHESSDHAAHDLLTKDIEVTCAKVPETVLAETLGPAFNGRYMSITPPTEESSPNVSGKRTTSYHLDFTIDEAVSEDDRPAWDVKNHIKSSLQKQRSYPRLKRQTDYVQEWHCKSTLIWLDLGPDYFPRYLRSVDCSSEYCWFKIYKCKPRAFGVRLLRRKKGKCVPGTRITSKDLPKGLRELWVWEERPVNFCCDCSLDIY